MDWKKAKNYTIIFLLLLNIMLLVLNIIKYNKYGLSPNQEKSIISVLEKNNITIEADIPSSFTPLPQLELKNSPFDALELQKIFFSDNKNLKRTEEFEKTIFSLENETLTINSNNATYVNNNKKEGFTLDEKSAVKLADSYATKIGETFSSLSLTKTTVAEKYISVEYDADYMEKKLFNNSVIFKVNSDGSVSCSFSYFEPMQFTGEKTDICSADEALFSFYKGIKDNFPNGEESIKIVKIDLGYYSDEYLDGDSQLTAVPHYRIYVDGVDQPYYINAYNSNMVFN